MIEPVVVDVAPPGFFARFGLAFRVLFDAMLARRLLLPDAPAALLEQKTVERIVEVERVVEKVVEVEKIVEKIVEKHRPPEEGALHLLAILQRDGRFVDFVREDLAGAKDADVGAAARLVHQGCRKALDAYFVLKAVRSEEEGAVVVVDKGFDPHAIRLAGDVKGEPPFKGTLVHGGWQAVEVKLPERPGFVDQRIVAPAEIEVRA
ncbi:MAG: DUF2760 domain-containing protein [Deltaproteobacteria bacterium]|nr:DUF2760 domain-containing protein [Deltaproteobacteria bacterium]